MNYETQGLQKRYFETLLQGNSEVCSVVIDEAIDKGLSLNNIYIHIITPSQIKLGELWHNGEISIAQEHLATNITIEQMARLRATFAPKKLHGLRAIVAVAEKDLHYLGAQMVADLLYSSGWRVAANASP